MDVIDTGSGGNINDRMGKYDNAISSDVEMTEKLDQIRKDQHKDIKTMDKKRKIQAQNAMNEYANNQSEHIRDINLLNQEIKGITKSNSVEKMCNLGLMSIIYVKRDIFQRYSESNTYSNMLINGENNYEKANDDEYIKMYVLNMMNNGLLTKLTQEQAIEFEKLLLFSLETVDKLYMIEMTRSELNNIILQKIVNVLIMRSDRMELFGPEIFKCESNQITDIGMKYILDYIGINDKDLKIIKAGHMFKEISSETCKLFGQVLDEKNEYLLKLSIDIQWNQYQTKIDKALKRNNDQFRKERNSNQPSSDNAVGGLMRVVSVSHDKQDEDDGVLIVEEMESAQMEPPNDAVDNESGKDTEMEDVELEIVNKEEPFDQDQNDMIDDKDNRENPMEEMGVTEIDEQEQNERNIIDQSQQNADVDADDYV